VALGAATAASRILFALARDAFASNPLGRASARSGAPSGALVAILGVAVVALIAYRVNGTEAVNAFFYPGTMGVLLMLVSYLVCNTGAIVFLYLRGRRLAPIFELPIPIITLAIILYVLYQNTLADSLEYPYTVFPLLVAGWLVIGLLIAVDRTPLEGGQRLAWAAPARLVSSWAAAASKRDTSPYGRAISSAPSRPPTSACAALPEEPSRCIDPSAWPCSKTFVSQS